MNPSIEELESALRSAPVPSPPPGLAEKLRSDIPKRSLPRPSDTRGSVWQRWWPVGVPGSALAAMAAVVVVQQMELNSALRSTSQQGSGSSNQVAPPVDSINAGVMTAAMGASPTEDPHAELDRLRQLVKDLTDQLASGDAVNQENARLEAELKKLKEELPDDLKATLEAKRRALSIRCVNNLKQLGLAVRIYATDYSDDFPADLKSVLPYGISPKVLRCPEDGDRPEVSMDDLKSQSVDQVASFSSYQFLAPGPGKLETDPTRVMFRCPIHGHVTLCDGSVQQIPLDSTNLVRIDGKLYYR